MYIRVKKEEEGQPENVIYEPRQPRNKPISHKMGIYKVPAKFKILFMRAVKKGKADQIPDDVAEKELGKLEKDRLGRMKKAKDKEIAEKEADAAKKRKAAEKKAKEEKQKKEAADKKKKEAADKKKADEDKKKAENTGGNK